jgi:hypothetical protein
VYSRIDFVFIGIARTRLRIICQGWRNPRRARYHIIAPNVSSQCKVFARESDPH